MEGLHQQQSPIGPIEQQRQQSIGNHKGPQASRMLPQNHRATLIALGIGRNSLVLSYHSKTPFFRQVRPTTPHLPPLPAKAAIRDDEAEIAHSTAPGNRPQKQKKTPYAASLILMHFGKGPPAEPAAREARRRGGARPIRQTGPRTKKRPARAPAAMALPWPRPEDQRGPESKRHPAGCRRRHRPRSPGRQRRRRAGPGARWESAPCERNDLSSRGLAPQYFRRGGA